jgi:hypothetical protein
MPAERELETSTPTEREFDRSFLGAYSARTTCSLSRANQCEEAPHCTAGRIVYSKFTVPSLQACWSASRKKRSAFTTFLREEHRSGATKRGKAA